jgi:phosphoribosyl 1,2-cyclic phosphate phosphodiesterase
MNEGLRVTFLGTGTSQGIPIIGSKHPVCLSDDPKDKRLRVSVLISWKNCNYVIDCGPDFRQQMLAHNVDKLDGILFTHEHSDHTAGLDDESDSIIFLRIPIGIRVRLVSMSIWSRITVRFPWAIFL